ncbi:hypothetical protein V2G26_012189 [Clonostachys chloroleuca]
MTSCWPSGKIYAANLDISIHVSNICKYDTALAGKIVGKRCCEIGCGFLSRIFGIPQLIEDKRLPTNPYGDIKEDVGNNASDFDVHMSLPLGINITVKLSFVDTTTPFTINSVSLGFINIA